ncbi:MAG TPA: 2OG-Fe(II) oxygenase [Azospirillum sp.]|nr:2OG-Fe(II) oxygenase [Azospirillum sp.]
MPHADPQALADTLRWKPELLVQFRDGLAARLKQRPDDPELLRQVAWLCRAAGDLAAARDACERLLAQDPGDREVLHHATVLRGEPEPGLFDPRAAMMPPFVYRTGFLPDDAVAALWEAVVALAPHFRPSGVEWYGKRSVDTDVRQSLTALADDRVRALVLEPARAMIARERLAERLGVRVTPGGAVMTQVHCHREADHFKAHRDGDEENLQHRELTFVYYFHRTPKRFRGGDLLMYDAGLERDVLYNPMRFTRVAPAHNSILFFPSRALHEVAPVSCSSDDLLDGRLTVTGWMARED